MKARLKLSSLFVYIELFFLFFAFSACNTTNKVINELYISVEGNDDANGSIDYDGPIDKAVSGIPFSSISFTQLSVDPANGDFNF